MQELLNGFIPPFLLSLLVSIGIGLIVGMEREFENLAGKEHFAGIRAFALMSLLGCVVTIVSQLFNPSVLLLVSPVVFIFISVFHYSKTKTENFGIVTELSLVLVFFLGVLSGLQFYKEALAAGVFISVLLTLKHKFRETIGRITQEELYAFIKFIILALLVLPFLPDQKYGPGGIFNFRDMGFVVVIVSSLSFIGYFIIKFFSAEKGIMFTAFFGGLISSTAVAWVFSHRSRENELLTKPYSSGILMACGVMFVRALIITGLFNIGVFNLLLVPVLIILAATALMFYLLKRKSDMASASGTVTVTNPLDLTTVFLFALLYSAITLFVYYANLYMGDKGLFLTGFIAGLGDVDAVTISISKQSLINIQNHVAAGVVLLAMIANTMFKIFIGYIRGTKNLGNMLLTALLPAMIIAIASAIYLYTLSR